MNRAKIEAVVMPNLCQDCIEMEDREARNWEGNGHVEASVPSVKLDRG